MVETYLDGLGGTSGAELPSPDIPLRRGAGTAPLCLGFCLGGSSGGMLLFAVGGSTPAFKVP